jgi:hypothetical protein
LQGASRVRFQDNLPVLLYELESPWHGCLSITDKKNFWIQRHFDHQDPPLIKLDLKAASAKKGHATRGGSFKKQN